MRHSKNYNFRLPERVDGRNDPADIDDLTYDLESTDGILKVQEDEDKRLDRDKLDKSAHNQHKTADILDHPDDSVTDTKIGNRTVLTSSGLLQTLLTAIGNAIKAIMGTEEWNAPPPTTLTVAKGHMDGRENPHTVTKEQVGLGSADNTRDMDKPVSTAQGAALTELGEIVSGKADTANVLTKDNTTEFIPTANYHPATKKYIDDQLGAAGSGDMMKAVYDQNGDGIVDNAEKVNGLTVQTSVPAGAKFTDTVYTHPETHPASMITGLPTSLPANGGRADSATSADSAKAVAWAAVSGKPGFVSTVTYSATIAAWTAQQNINVAGIVATDNPVIDVVLSGDYGTDMARLEAWGNVTRIVTYNGGITVVCYDTAPTVAIPIQIKVVR